MLSLSSCRDELVVESEELDLTTYTDWTEATHGNSVAPDYSTVFAQDKVLRFDITISSKEKEKLI